MKKNYIKKISVFVFIVLMSITYMNKIYAHPGRTDSNGCHYCRTNCAKWGLSNNEYHCHNGSSSNTTNNSNTNTNTSTKSSDNKIKALYIDDIKQDISDNINYETKNNKVNIVVEPNSSKAKYTIENKDLDIGKNIIKIVVTAENGNKKTYQVNVNRLKLSDNKNVEIYVDDNILIFENYVSNITVPNEIEKLNYSYKLEDENSKIELENENELIVGENIYNFKVTAEDNTEQVYKVVILREDKIIDNNSNIINVDSNNSNDNNNDSINNSDTISDESNDNVNNDNNSISSDENTNSDNENNNEDMSLPYALGGLAIYGGLGYFIFKKIKH